MELDLQVIRQQVVHATKALLEQANLKAGDIFVLGCSSSEICGGHIGKASSEEVGQVVIDAILPVLRERGIFLAVQGCEHINRSLVVEREAAERYDLEIVTVKPALHAGGACAVAAYDRAEHRLWWSTSRQKPGWILVTPLSVSTSSTYRFRFVWTSTKSGRHTPPLCAADPN